MKEKQIKKWRGSLPEPIKCPRKKGYHKGCFGSSDYELKQESDEK